MGKEKTVLNNAGEYKEVKIIKYKRSKVFYAFCIVAASLCLTVSVSYLIVPSFAFLGALPVGVQSLILERKQFYAVTVEEFTYQSDAQDYARNIKLKGGAGYVLVDTSYFVAAAVYDDIDSAIKIKDNLVAGAYRAQVITLELERKEITGLNNTDKTNIKKAHDALVNLYKNLYALSVKLDLSEKAKDEVKLEILKLKNETINLNTGMRDSTNKAAGAMKKVLTQAEETLNYLTTEAASDSALYPYTAEIKYAYVKILCELSEFCRIDFS